MVLLEIYLLYELLAALFYDEHGGAAGAVREFNAVGSLACSEVLLGNHLAHGVHEHRLHRGCLGGSERRAHRTGPYAHEHLGTCRADRPDSV